MEYETIMEILKTETGRIVCTMGRHLKPTAKLFFKRFILRIYGILSRFNKKLLLDIFQVPMDKNQMTNKKNASMFFNFIKAFYYKQLYIFICSKVRLNSFPILEVPLHLH